METKRRRLLVDDGTAFEPTPAALAHHLGVGVSNTDLVDYAVRNLGMVEVRFERDLLRLAARPALISPATLNGMQQLVAGWRGARVALMSFDGGAWQASIMGNAHDAVETLRALARQQSSHPGWSTFEATPVRLETLKGPAYDGMRLLAAEWSLLGGVMDRSMLAEFTQRRLAPGRSNAVLAQRSPDGSGIIVEHARGAERCPPAVAWLSHASGRDLREHEDRPYAAWLTETYRDVLATGRPRLETVRATLRCPEYGPRAFHYDRLILPWTRRASADDDGSPIATLLSVVRKVAKGSEAMLVSS
jgi:hypothetical protein